MSLDALVALGDDIAATYISPEGFSLVSSVDVVSSAFTVGARVPVGAGVSVVADLPFAYARLASPDLPAVGVEGTTEDDVSVGNPYVGAEARVGGAVTLGGGVRLPLAQYDRIGGFADPADFAWQGGFTADPERFEAYLPEVLTVSASARYEPLVGPVRLRALLAPAYLRDVSGDEFFGNPNPPRTGLVLGYQAQAEVAAGPVALSGGLFGRPVLAGERFELFSADATLALGASVRLARVQPGVSLRVPLDGERFIFGSDATVAFSLDVPLR